jgi:hypothetical protein
MHEVKNKRAIFSVYRAYSVNTDKILMRQCEV